MTTAISSNSEDLRQQLGLGSSSTVNFSGVNVTASTIPTNGMYLPAANSVGIASNSVERLRIDSSGNVGIGTNGAPSCRLHAIDSGQLLKTVLTLENDSTSGVTLGVGQAFKVYNGSSVSTIGGLVATGSTFSYGTFSANQFSISSSGTGGIRVSSASAPITFHTGNADCDLSTERLRIDSSGNVYGTSGTTGMTNGFIYVPSAAGAPSGAATSIAGHCPLYVDETNNRIYVRIGSSWKYASLT